MSGLFDLVADLIRGESPENRPESPQNRPGEDGARLEKSPGSPESPMGTQECAKSKRWHVTLEDGGAVEVDAPSGLTRDEALTYAAHHGRPIKAEALNMCVTRIGGTQPGDVAYVDGFGVWRYTSTPGLLEADGPDRAGEP